MFSGPRALNSTHLADKGPAGASFGVTSSSAMLATADGGVATTSVPSTARVPRLPMRRSAPGRTYKLLLRLPLVDAACSG